MSGRAGGLGEVIARQLSRNVQGGLAEGAAAGAVSGASNGTSAGRTAVTGWRSTMAVAERHGMGTEVKGRIRTLVASERTSDRFVSKVLGRELQQP